MYIKNNTIAVIFRIVFIVICGAGLVIKLLTTGFGLAVFMSDFALFSNGLAFFYFVYLIIARPDYENGIIRGAVIIYMIVVFFVYYFDHVGTPVLSFEKTDLAAYLLYFAAPVMAFVDYLLFCEKGEFADYGPVIWAIIPVLFNLAIFFINKMGLASTSVPYFNWLEMKLPVALMTFLGIGYLLFFVDSLMAGRRR